MMKLYYNAGSCSTCCHIALEESGLPYETVQVHFDKPDAKLEEVNRLNPLGAVPVLITDNGGTLTQNAAILEYVADKAPKSCLLPAAGTFERAEAMSWLSFVAADLHKAFRPIFALESTTTHEAARAEIREWALGNVHECLACADAGLAGKDYLTGKTFTAADSYLFVVAGWCQYVNVKLDAYKNLTAFMARVRQRPAVQKVLKTEGLHDWSAA